MSAAAAVSKAQAALTAGGHARVVRHASLKPARPGDAEQLRFAVEDALRTADFNDCGRFIVVRRLRLQGLPLRASATVVAQALQDAWRVLAPRAVAHRHPQAEDADAVFFASRFAARMAWLESLAGDCSLHAWYWHAALPELAWNGVQLDPRLCADTVVEALLQESAGETAAALRAWNDDALIALARCLPPKSNDRLLAAVTRIGAPSPSFAAQPQPAPRAGARTVSAAAWMLLVGRVARAASPSAPAPWLAALWIWALTDELPTHADVERLLSCVAPDRPAHSGRAGAAQGDAGASSRGHVESRSQENAGPVSRHADDAVATPSESWSSTAHRPPGAESADRPPSMRMEADFPGATRSRSGQKPHRLPLALPWLDDALATGHGGLMLLLNVLSALRFDAWLSNQEPAAREPIVNAVFTHVLAATACAPTDPQWQWFEEQVQAAEALVTIARLWTLRVRRTLRRHARMDLGELIRRRAWVCAGPNHIDIVFALDETDLRLRRLGLDSDPGWVPWFGRIVAFHFIAGELLPPDDGGCIPAAHG